MNDVLQRRPRVAETKLRPMNVGDLAAVHGLAHQMSWPHRPEDCANLFRLGAGTVAVDQTGDVIGAGMRWAFGRDVGTIGMMLVAREYQGHGIGRALMRTLIDDSSPRQLMLNATAEGQGLYDKLGFVATGQVRQHQVHWAGGMASPAAPSVKIRHAVASDQPALCALDAAAFGADRSALIGSLLAAGQAWVIDSAAGRPTGFAILRNFGRGSMIGPVVASDENEAIALVAAAAGAASPGILRVDVPTRAESLGAWLMAVGLPAIDTVTTMLRGTWPATFKEPQRFGLALQAVG